MSIATVPTGQTPWWASRGRVPAHAPPCVRVTPCGPPSGDASRTRTRWLLLIRRQDIPNTRTTDGTARQGGTIARCSFVVTIFLTNYASLFVPIASTPRQSALYPLSTSLAFVLSELGASRILAGSAATASPRGFLQFGAPATSFQNYARVFRLWSSRLRGATKVDLRTSYCRRIIVVHVKMTSDSSNQVHVYVLST